jgi:hypothetical protein
MGDLSIYDPVFKEAGLEWNVDPTLLKAVAAQESGGKSQAVSKAGAAGLMGIMPDTGRGLGMTDLKDPVQSIWGGAKYLASALDAEGTPQKALLYYHGGPDWRQRFGPESAAYVPSVAKHYQQFAGLGVPTAGGAGPAAADGAPGGAAPPAATGGAGKVESDADFLKRTTSGQAKPSGESDADFLKRTTQGAKSETPPAAEPTPAPTLDEYGRAAPDIKLPPSSIAPGTAAAAVVQGPNAASVPTQGPPTPAADVITGVLGRVGQAAVQGFQGTPNLLTPEAQASLEAQGPVGRYISGPLIKIGNQVLGAAGAVGGAAGQALYEAGNALGGPSLGRDLYMGGQVAPVAGMGAGVPNMLEPPAGVAPRFVQERFGEPPPGRLPQLLGAIDRADQQPIRQPGNLLDQSALTQPPPRPMVGEGATQSVGAAASREGSAPGTFGLSPKEAAAYRSTAEGQKLLEAQQPGIPDRTAYVPGVEPSAAEIEQSVNTSRELKSLKLQAPEVSEEARAVAAQNNDARRMHFEQLAGSDVSLMNAKAARAAQAEADLKATWAGKTEANPAAVLDKAAEIKASPDGRRPLVRGAIDSVTSELTGPDGKLITDPEQLYGVRKHIDDLTSREAAAADPKNVRAVAALDQLKTELDTVIEASAPGFKQYLQNFSSASRPIDAMEALQKFEPKLYDAQNRMQYSRVQSMMRQIVDARSAPGVNAFKSIPDETMQQLWNLRDDLRRSAGAEELARTTGSDTAQNAWDIAKTYAKAGGTAAAHGVANAISPGFGSMALTGARNMLAPIFSARNARKQTTRGMEMLHPKDNLLQPPP